MSKGVKSIDRQTLVFDKRQTNIAKGVALLLLLWHHLFYNSPEYYERFVSLYIFHGVPIECQIARFCKVCVAIFLLLSGYGLTKSFSKYRSENLINAKLSIRKNCKYTFNHLIKLLSDYWFIYIIFVPLGLLFGRSFLLYYGINPIYYLADFFGVSYLLFEYNATMNVTWWFMSIIIVYYLAFPLLHRIMRYSPELLLLLSLFILFCPFIPDFRQLKVWICPFVFGMYISYYSSFETIKNRINTYPKALGCSLIAIAITAYLRLSFFENKPTIDFLFAFAIIIFSFLCVSRIPILNTILEHLGKYCGLIFMFHTFVFSYYFQDFIYWFKYPPIIFLVLTVVCYAIALGIEWLRRITRYDKLIEKVINL